MVRGKAIGLLAVVLAAGLAGTACSAQMSEARRQLEQHYQHLRSTYDQSDLSFYRPPADQELLPATEARRPRNVILLIGDGMGHNHIALARHRTVGSDGRLHMERMPVLGQVRTRSANRAVTDSSAAATALACGIETDNDRIGMAPDGTAFTTILQKARENGFRTGLVATSSITHATPAAFASHVTGRDMQTEIAVQFLSNGVDVLLGGGCRYWLCGPEGVRPDGRNLVEEARAKGYLVIDRRKQLADLDEIPVLGLSADDGMTTFLPEPALDEMTRVAIDLLSARSRKNGSAAKMRFFMMIEGSQIDWAAHVNDAEYMVRQTLLFDLAVKEALQFAQSDEQTLVLVVADHETGGLALGVEDNRPVAVWTSDDHTAADVPLYAFGPGAAHFSGTYHLTEVPRILARVLGFEGFPAPRRLVRAAEPVATY